MNNYTKQIRLIKDIVVGDKLSISRSTVWQMLKNISDFPKPISISPHSTRWYEHEIDDYIASRPRLRGNSNTPNK